MARIAIILVTTFALACANRLSEIGGHESELSSGHGYTLVNLHPDNQHNRLYAVNFQQAGLIPVCSEVEYLGLGRKYFKFRVLSTNREYAYVNHKAAAEPFADHLKRFFGPSCPAEEIGSLSEIDRQGIREGRAIRGMSRRGVILAMGHPPRHVNPDPDAAAFIYWKSRFNRVEVQFGPEGFVSGIKD